MTVPSMNNTYRFSLVVSSCNVQPGPDSPGSEDDCPSKEMFDIKKRKNTTSEPSSYFELNHIIFQRIFIHKLNRILYSRGGRTPGPICIKQPTKTLFHLLLLQKMIRVNSRIKYKHGPSGTVFASTFITTNK